MDIYLDSNLELNNLFFYNFTYYISNFYLLWIKNVIKIKTKT